VSEHFTLDELAELDEGLLARGRAAAAERHIADFEECSARADAVRESRAALRDLGSVRMPADVAARIDRALRDADATSAADIVPDLAEVRARRFGRIPPWAYAAAAAVVVLAGVGIGVGTAHHHNKASESAASTKVPLVATAKSPAQFVQQESGQTYTPNSLPQAAPALLGDVSRFDASGAAGAPNTGPVPGAAGGGGTSSSAGISPRHAAPSQNAPLAPAPAVAAPKSALSIAPPLQRLATSRSALLRCAAFITDTADAAPLVVDFGRWTNAKAHVNRVPAVIFVFSDNQDANKIDVYVVGAACDGNSLLAFQVLNKTP
jgi:hypothetical protein